MRWTLPLVLAGCAGPVVLEDGFEKTLTRTASCGGDAYVALDAHERVRLQVELPNLSGSFPLPEDDEGYFHVYTGHHLLASSGDLCTDLASESRPRYDYLYDAAGGAAEIVGEEGQQDVAVQGLLLRADNELLPDGEGEDDWKDLDDLRLQSYTFKSR